MSSRTYWQTTYVKPYWKGKLVDYFALGVPAYRLRHSVPASLRTIERFYRSIRQAIYQDSLRQLALLEGSLELDETLFGGRVKGSKRGWGAAGKRMVFGIYQRNGTVLTFPIDSRAGDTLIPLITHHTKSGSLYYTDKWWAYTFLPIRGTHVVVTKEKGVPKGRDHLNGIEGFWSYAKHWLYQYRGVPKAYFHLYLKEIEWRFNHRNRNLQPLLRGLLNQSVKVQRV